ncbi:MAG: hypothetical protein AMJ88_02220 [Anaerolineae bacterium SM23_ 63]|nr:MAG: hypothetical protein AMJ88_02220 [Anaerolineae bacterium SM23_ 63]HEY47363.1 hypothetical protein [Anaerolineae bacterium]
MSETILATLLVFNQILNAGNAITAFSLLLYALTFNVRERVARSLALLLSCVALVYFGDVLTSLAQSNSEIELWLRVQWVGIAFVPATYLHLSDALLEATGRPSRGRRIVVVFISYLGGALILAAAGLSKLVAGELAFSDSVAYLRPGTLFPLFLLFSLIILMFATVNLWRSYQRCLTRSSRRRMRYLMIGSIGPLLGAFPFLMIGGPGLAAQPLIFWGLLVLINISVAIQIVMITYTVAYFGVSFPDRVVKSRLFQWILRGPVVASTVLAVTVIVNRLSARLGLENSRAVPFTMVAVLLLLQYVITLIRPTIERWFFYGEDRGDVARLQLLEERLLTSGDVKQFLESVLNAACDVMGVGSAFVAVVGQEGLELEVAVGSHDPLRDAEDLPPLLVTDEKADFDLLGSVFTWDVYWLIPLRLADPPEIVGLFGLYARAAEPNFSPEEEARLKVLVGRATVALADRILQREVFSAVDRLVPEVEDIQRLRAAALYGKAGSLTVAMDGVHTQDEVANLVKEALGHYWGGPRLTRSPLLELRVVRRAAQEHDGNPVNALRAILRQAIERVRPEGDRRFTAEWMLYNILEMKFLQGRKVRDVAMRLAMSEADLYRKQRVAIEEVARAVAEMEREVVASETTEGSLSEDR